MNCPGCGKDMGYFPHIPATESWHEFCGDCNKRYYEQEAEMARIAEERKEAKMKAEWERLTAKYGADLAGEIMADSYGPL